MMVVPNQAASAAGRVDHLAGNPAECDAPSGCCMRTHLPPAWLRCG